MFTRFKKAIAVLVLWVFVLSSFSAAAFAQAPIRIDINGKTVNTGSLQSYLSGSSVMVPIRNVSEALGANVSWDISNKNITLVMGDKTAIIKQGSSKVYVNGRGFSLGVGAVVKNGTTYVSDDFIKTVFGYTTSYNSEKSSLSIKISSLPVYFSDSFSIKYLDNGCKLLTDGENFRILLVPEGKKAPGGVKADKTVSIPLKKVLAASSTQVGPLVKLGVLNSLKAVTTPGEDWNSPEMKKLFKAGSVKYVGGAGMGQPDYEQVKAVNPDMVFVYTGSYGQQSIIEKMDEMGINFAVNNEYLESHYLGRMEWIKFMAAFYDKELEAEKLFNDAVKKIDTITAHIAGLEEPKVVWANPSGKGTVNVANPSSYVGKWIGMTGGNYAFKDVGIGAGTSISLSMEEFYAKAKDADVFIYSSTVGYIQTPTIAGIVKENPLFADIKAVKNGNVWAYDNGWWETIPETDKIIYDLAAVFHPDAYKGYQPTKFVKLPAK